MIWKTAWCLAVTTAGGWSAARAQAADSAAAAAVGVYRAAPPAPESTAPVPSDTGGGPSPNPVDTNAPVPLPGDTAAPDPVPRDSVNPAPAAADSAVPAPPSVQEVTPRDSLPPAMGDTSLTSRLDARRGGGLTRREFPDLSAVASGAGGYKLFLELVAEGGAAGILAGDSLVTLLAPTDSAFAELPAADLARLRTDPEFLEAWLSTVVLPGNQGSRELLAAGEARSRSGAVIRFGRQGDGWIHAGPARVVQPDLYARNGILHGIDRVILPDTTSAAP